MKKRIFGLILAMFLIIPTVLLTACGNDNKKSEKIQVYTSFYPLYEFTQMIGGNKVEVTNLVKPGEEAHHYEPTAKQLVELTNADLIVINGAGMESWMEKLSTSTQAKILNTSKNVSLIERTTNASNEHDHDHDDEDHDHDHDHHDGDGHNHGTHDPHIWLSLKNAVIMLENIKDKLVSLDNKNASFYQDNFVKNKILFEALDKKYEEALSPFADKYFIVSHRAFGYIAHEYDLKQYSLAGIEDNEEPDGKTSKEIIDFMTANKIKHIFYHTNSNSKAAKSIAGQTNATALELSTIEGLSQEQIDNGDGYLSLMALNLHRLTIALS